MGQITTLTNHKHLKWFAYALAFYLLLAGNLSAVAAENTASNLKDSLFICLPYLHDVHYDASGAAVLRLQTNDQTEADLSRHIWSATARTIPDQITTAGRISIVDTDQASAPKTDQAGDILIPVPLRRAHAGPLRSISAEQSPIWLQLFQHNRLQAWQTPALTPLVIAKELAEKKRKQKLAEEMADRAFYFGYDTNKDALK